MPDSESILVVPLRSNAYTLLTGKPIATIRRRLKFASLFYDRLLLETGIFRVNAGPSGSSSFIVPPTEEDPPHWQTPAERHAGTGVPFVVMITPDGRPDATPRTAVSSVASICWTATLHPFEDELPPGTDWVDFVKSIDPADEVGRMAQRWTRADERNPALEHAIPVRFARQVVINSANRDLVLAAAAGCSVTVDPLHMQVVTQRFKDADGWGLRGYSVPVLFPAVADMPWEAIADLRRDRNIAQFRAVLREVEAEAGVEVARGDIEAAAHHAYERHLAKASGRLEGVGSVTRRTAAGIVIGGAIGVATSPIAGPLAIVVSTGAAAVLSTIGDVRNMLRQRQSRGWVTVHHRITSDQ